METLRLWLRDTPFDFFMLGWWLGLILALGTAFYLGHALWPIRLRRRRSHLRRIK